jgi:hypothetical protein
MDRYRDYRLRSLVFSFPASSIPADHSDSDSSLKSLTSFPSAPPVEMSVIDDANFGFNYSCAQGGAWETTVDSASFSSGTLHYTYSSNCTASYSFLGKLALAVKVPTSELFPH